MRINNIKIYKEVNGEKRILFSIELNSIIYDRFTFLEEKRYKQ